MFAPGQQRDSSTQAVQRGFELLFAFRGCKCPGTVDALGPTRPALQAKFVVTRGSVDLFVVHQEAPGNLFRHFS